MIGRYIRVSPKPDHLVVTFRYMTPMMRMVLSFALQCLRILMILCFISDLIGAFLSVSQNNGYTPDGFLAEAYLGPIYALFSVVTDFYVRVLLDWVGLPRILYFIVPIAATVSIVTWTKGIRIADNFDLLPRLLSPILSQRKKIRFYPGHLKIGLRRVPFESEAGAFRLDRPKRLREGKKVTREYYGDQEIVYDAHASKYSVAVFWNADRATKVQNSLSVALQWWRDNLMSFKVEESTPGAPINQDIALD